MSVTVHSVGQVENVVATPKAGGSLDADTTYYVRVDAEKFLLNTYHSAGDIRYPGIWGMPSTEISFVTTTENKQADITWDAIADATAYDVYVTKVSGDYNSGQWGVHKTCMGYPWAADTTTNSYTLSANPTIGANYARMRTWLHAPYLVLPLGLSVEGERLGIELSGTCTLQDIKDACDTAGYSDHCYYDGMVFGLRGNICALTNTVAFAPRNTVMYMVEGDFCANQGLTSISFSFGDYDSVEKVAYNRCWIKLLGPGNVLDSFSSGTLYMYADVSGKVGEIYVGGYYTNFNAEYILANTDRHDWRGGSIDSFSVVGFQGSVLLEDVIVKNVTGGASFDAPGGHNNITGYNTKFGSQNGYSRSFKNVTIYQNPASQGYTDSDFQVSDYGSGTSNVWNLYNFTTLRTNNQISLYWYCPSGATPTVKMNAQVEIFVIDKDNNPIEGATVTLVDKNGLQQFSESTDSDGEIAESYGVFQSAVEASPDVTGYDSVWTTFNPFILTVSKSGYKTYTSTFTLEVKKTLTITLGKVLVNNLSKYNKINFQ